MNKEMKTLTFGDVTYEVVDEKAREGVNKHEAELLKAFVEVTTDSITKALGYTPANQEKVSQLSDEIVGQNGRIAEAVETEFHW